jgi:tetratricopeptide (TPR) repeat protein
MSRSSKDITVAVSSPPNTGTELHPSTYTRMVQNFRLIWLDADIDEVNDLAWRENIARLRRTINTIDTFTNADECIQFLINIKDETVFLVVNGYVVQHIVSVIHNMSQLDSIYILCGNKSRHEQWAKQWVKITGVFTEISAICDTLKKAAQQYDQNYISIGFMPTSDEPSNKNLDQLDQSFMYSQILKDILLTIDFDESHVKSFTDYCRTEFAGKNHELQTVDELEQNYYEHSSIWWYTYESFLYSMLNRALRQMEVDTIIKMGFFVSDLHRQIAELHDEQFSEDQPSQPTIVYRGQGLLKTDFNKMLNTKGGLISFNNFLSTSRNDQVSINFARQSLRKSNFVGVLFVITIIPFIKSTPFAAVNDVSDYKEENEILFSMHSVFRINDIKPLEDDNRLWEVQISLTSDDDQNLRALTNRLQAETQGWTGWQRLAMLLIQLANYDKANQLLSSLLSQTFDLSEESLIYDMLGMTESNKGQYSTALSCYEKALAIDKQTLPPNHPDLATSYSNIGQVYSNMGDYPKALSFYEKALGMRKETLPPNHPSLATSYSNIGQVYSNMGDYPKALSFYEKALGMRKETLPPNHPDLATSYSNIGQVYSNMGDYPKALSFYEKALGICQETLPPNHPDLATSYSNIGQVYSNMGDYPKALSFYEKALGICQETLPPNHPDLATSYRCIGHVYNSLGEYSKGLSYLMKAEDIYKISLPSCHPSLANYYSIIGVVYDNMGEYEKSLSSHEKALEMRKKLFNTEHPNLAVSYSNPGLVYCHVNEYSKALMCHEKALEIRQKSLHPMHPDMAICYNDIGLVYSKMCEYEKALSFYDKAVDIRQKTLPSNHPYLAATYDNMGKVHENTSEYSKALSFYQRALDIGQYSLPENHPHLILYRDHIDSVKNKL